MTNIHFREAQDVDLPAILDVLASAFGEESVSIHTLVKDLLADDTAKPIVSLVAEDEGSMLVGHVLFTKVVIAGHEDVKASILAPLAISAEHQKGGVGQKLIQDGLARLKAEAVELVFVLGHPEYYPKAGFVPAGELGLEAPYPIPKEVSGAWMVQALTEGVLGRVKGKVACTASMDREEYWRE